jgi:hypothetical protein
LNSISLGENPFLEEPEPAITKFVQGTLAGMVSKIYENMLEEIKYKKSNKVEPADEWQRMHPRKARVSSIPNYESVTAESLASIHNSESVTAKSLASISSSESVTAKSLAISPNFKLLKTIASNVQRMPELMPTAVLANCRLLAAGNCASDKLEDYFKLLMKELLDRNDRGAISSAQDIFSALKRFDPNIQGLAGPYALSRLLSHASGKNELDASQVSRLKIYLTNLDGLYDREKYLREWSAKLGEAKLTGAFYLAFAKATPESLNAYSEHFKGPALPKPTDSALDAFLSA